MQSYSTLATFSFGHSTIDGVSIIFPPQIHHPLNFQMPCLCVHGRHGQDLAPLLPPQLGSHDSIDARADRISGLVDEDTSVVVKANDAPVATLHLRFGSDHDSVAHVAALYFVGQRGAGHAFGAGSPVFLNDDDDSVT